MHDYDIDLAGRAPRRAPEGSAAEGPAGAPGLRGAHHDAASLMHLQRTAGNAGVVQLLAEDEPSPVHEVVGRSGGAPLDESTRATMESSFGQSFEDVRIHTDPQASKSAEAVGANAYTVGSDIVFRAGQFDASSATGQRTLAHELTHVVQQRSGPVDGTDAPGGIRLSDPSDRFERAAEQTAGEIVSGMGASGAAPAASDAAQRDLEEEAAVQTTLQRDALDEEEEEEPMAG
jgi:hypothetical protein